MSLVFFVDNKLSLGCILLNTQFLIILLPVLINTPVIKDGYLVNKPLQAAGILVDNA